MDEHARAGHRGRDAGAVDRRLEHHAVRDAELGRAGAQPVLFLPARGRADQSQVDGRAPDRDRRHGLEQLADPLAALDRPDPQELVTVSWRRRIRAERAKVDHVRDHADRLRGDAAPGGDRRGQGRADREEPTAVADEPPVRGCRARVGESPRHRAVVLRDHQRDAESVRQCRCRDAVRQSRVGMDEVEWPAPVQGRAERDERRGLPVREVGRMAPPVIGRHDRRQPGDRHASAPRGRRRDGEGSLDGGDERRDRHAGVSVTRPTERLRRGDDDVQAGADQGRDLVADEAAAARRVMGRVPARDDEDARRRRRHPGGPPGGGATESTRAR